MSQDVVMPALGMAMTEGTLLRWLKRPGEPVEQGEVIAEIETDKAVMELESPAAGRMGAHLVEEGAVVPTGVPVTRIDGSAPEPAVATAQVAAAEPGERAAVLPAPPPLAPGSGPTSEPKAGALEALRVVPESEPRPVDLDGIADDVAVEWLRTMLLIRAFEEACDPLVRSGKIPGGVHSAAGQEAVAVGAVRALRSHDIVTSSHRSHHHALAKGLTPRAVMAELYGRVDGCLGGRGGHMHLADFSIGLFGSNGIVGGGLGIAMGASLAAHLRHVDQVAMGFFGDGGANTGRVWEFVNLASAWRLPLVVVCENNLYAVETFVGRVMAGESIARRAEGFGLPALQVDGQDVAAMNRAVGEARRRAVAGEGPTFIEALTYRHYAHGIGESDPYRTREEVAAWRGTRDPIVRLRAALAQRGAMSEEEWTGLRQEVDAVVEDAKDFAERSAWPDPATATQGVTSLAWSVGRNL